MEPECSLPHSQASLSCASPIQSTYPHPTSWRSILILSTHLRLGLPGGLFPSGFPTKTLYVPLSSPIGWRYRKRTLIKFKRVWVDKILTDLQEIGCKGAPTELVWYKIGRSDGMLCKLLWNVGFSKMGSIYGLVSELETDEKKILFCVVV